ncbi:MAG: hypothetical protein AB7J30_05975 [Hyphomicrobium sp.]
MIGKYSRIAALAGLAIFNAHAAFAGAADYTVEGSVVFTAKD